MNKFQIILTLLVITGCSRLPAKRQILVPQTSFRINQNILKTNGYYYAERTRDAFCRSVPFASGVSRDPDSKYEQKYISAFILDQDGYSYYTGNLIISGVDGTLLDHCGEVTSNNTFDLARKKFENYLSEAPKTPDYSKHDKGVFKLIDDTIKIQVYQTGAPVLILMEYEGIVVNDTTFRLNNQKYYDGSKIGKNYELDDIYHFKALKAKPDSANYIRDNRYRFRLSSKVD